LKRITLSIPYFAAQSGGEPPARLCRAFNQIGAQSSPARLCRAFNQIGAQSAPARLCRAFNQIGAQSAPGTSPDCALGRYVRQQRIFDPRDLILELQFAFFQPRKLQLIAMGGARNRGDRSIEVAVLLSKLRELGA
jgi:hypothetical protein